MFDLLADAVYTWWGSTMIDVEKSLHNPPSEYLKNAQLAMLDGDVNHVWEYNLYDCWPQKISPSDLAYSSADIAEITVTLRYGKCRETRNQGALIAT